MSNQKHTSKHIAKIAAKVLKDTHADKITKSLAGSALSQTLKK